ncbi:MAG: ATP-binding protein [Chloroflexi bacterium]|nr:ATP-binding protein [Chloroflexota bacterium]
METVGQILQQYQAKATGPGPAATSSSDAADADGCPLCGGIGWVRHDVPLGDAEFGRLFPCECRLAEFEAGRHQRLMRLSNLGNLEGVTFESLARATGDSHRPNPTMESGLRVAAQYAQEPRGWLIIEGPPGSGKTRVAAAIANECVARGIAVLFLPVADLLDHLRATFAPSSDVAYDELFDQIRNIPLLILDDLGTESATPWAREKLSQLLGHRYAAASPTVVTTDVPLEKLDDRVRSRLTDPAISQAIRLAATSMASSNGVDRLDLALPHMTFESFSPDGMGLRGPIRQNLREAWELAQRFAEHPEGWLVYFGQHGSGKTHLAAAIADYCRKRGDDTLFLLVPKLLDYLRSVSSQPGGPSFEAFDRVERVGLLILDDFSQSLDTPWARDKLDQLLNFRGLTRLPTVITSSLSPDDMEPRIWSRMNDPRLSDIYELRAPDYRTGQEKSPARTADSTRGRPRGRGASR